jgi:hypothetical protein
MSAPSAAFRLILASIGAVWAIRIAARYRADRERHRDDPVILRSFRRRFWILVAFPLLILASWIAFLVA